MRIHYFLDYWAREQPDAEIVREMAEVAEQTLRRCIGLIHAEK